MRPLLLQYHSRPVRTVKFNRDGDIILSCSDDGLVNCISATTGERIGSYNGHNGAAVKSADINLDSTLVVSGGADSNVVFYDAETGHILYILDHGGILKGVEFNQNPGKNNEIVTCSDRFQNYKNRICVWEFDNLERSPDPCKLVLQIDATLPLKATKVKWGPFDKTLISIHEEGQFCVWNRKGDLLRTISAHHQSITGIQFNHDRSLMITCSRDQTAKLWEMADYENVKTYKTNRPLNDSAISPLYTNHDHPKYHVLAGGGVEAIHAATTAEGGFETVLFNMVMEEEIGTIKGHFGPMNTLSIAPDGMSYVTGGEEGLIRIMKWEPDYLTRKDL